MERRPFSRGRGQGILSGRGGASAGNWKIDFDPNLFVTNHPARRPPRQVELSGEVQGPEAAGKFVFESPKDGRPPIASDEKTKVKVAGAADHADRPTRVTRWGRDYSDKPCGPIGGAAKISAREHIPAA